MKYLIVLCTLIASSMAFSCDTTDICEGDRVIHQLKTGTVSEVYNNNKIKISLDKPFEMLDRKISWITVSKNSVSKAVTCVDAGLCIGDRVFLNHEGFDSGSGTVKEAFDNGFVKVKYDGLFSFQYLILRAKDL